MLLRSMDAPATKVDVKNINGKLDKMSNSCREQQHPCPADRRDEGDSKEPVVLVRPVRGDEETSSLYTRGGKDTTH